MTDDIRNCGDLDERLAPYVDGEATPESSRAIEAHLAACPPCRKDAEAEAAARQLLHDHRGTLKGSAPEALRARCLEAVRTPNLQISTPNAQVSRPDFQAASARRSALRRWVPLSLAATLLLAVGGVFLLGLNDRVEALALSLAIDHVKCFAMPPTAPVEPAEAAQHWQQDQGWPITVPQTEPAEQLRLIGVRRCLSADGRVAHLMYTWHGAPLSVYVVQTDAGRDCVTDRIGREAVIWSTQGRTYAVIADGHPDLQHIAGYMKTHVH
jgi:anti-sigma factor (TIGR02949 family)